jgi:crotonobetainyl-CoA:carnitine CoA-transferase CaiB-like acyl-CoA transferase
MTGPLAGVVIADLTRALSGPHATMLLADLGARVIKIEQPDTGDESRLWGPPFVASGEPGQPPVSTYFLACNRNKESVSCDIRTQAGHELLTRLVRQADVLVENFRPGVLARLGFAEARLLELNPRLVICSITGFGHDGPDSGRPGYDQIAQGEGGLMSVTGPDAAHPMKSGLSVADLMAGGNAALGIVAALYERDRTGKGRVVRTSLLAGMVSAHANQGTRWTVAGELPVPAGNHHPVIAPYGTFRCADGIIQVGVANEQQWRRFAPLVGLDPADERYASNDRRVAHRDALTDAIEAVLAGEDREHWLGVLAGAGVPAGSIRRIDEVYEWEQTRSQGLVISVDHPVLGPIELPGPALRFDGEPARTHQAPPLLGQHDSAVRAWLDEAEAGAGVEARRRGGIGEHGSGRD